MNITEKLFNDIIAFRASRSLEVEFSTVSGQQDVILDTTALLVRSYVLTLSDSTSKAVSVYQGVARFELAESAFNFWAITQWRDFHADLETRSWAELKNAYR